MDERPDNSEQLMNILLVMDQEKRSSYLPRVTRKRRGNVTAEHPEFGKIRTVEKDGKIWFCARDIAASLGYANTRDAIDRHCKQKGVCIHDIPITGGRQKVKVIDEGNVYRLIAGSRLPSAERFESWIFDELVPRTLKEGGYLLEKEGRNRLRTAFTGLVARRKQDKGT